MVSSKIFWISIKIIIFTFINFWYFSFGVSYKKNITQSWYFQKNLFVHPINLFSFIIFRFYYHVPLWERTWVVYTKIIDHTYPPQHSRNLVYYQLLIHHLQVLPHQHLSCLDLIINTLLPIRKITTYQKQMTSSHV